MILLILFSFDLVLIVFNRKKKLIISFITLCSIIINSLLKSQAWPLKFKSTQTSPQSTKPSQTFRLKEKMKLCIFAKINVSITLTDLKHLRITKLKVLYVKISLKLDCARMVTNANSLTGPTNWDVTQTSTFLTKPNIVTLFWIRNAAFMDLDVTSSIRTASKWIKKLNG